MARLKKYERAIFFIDPLRPLVPGDCPTQKNLNWIYGLFRSLLDINGAKSVTFHQLISPSFIELQEILYNGLGYEESLEKWAFLYEFGIDFQIGVEKNDLIIGFELSPFMKNKINKENIDFIDIRVHPSRYLNDLILSFYSNNIHLNQLFCLNSREWGDRPVSVATMAGYFGRRPGKIITDGTIFLAQSRHDATVINDGKFIEFSDILPRFIDVISGPLYVLPHPADPENPIVTKMVQDLGALSLAGENFYSLALNCESTVDFVTFTSGSGREAEDFGRKVDFLGVNNYGISSLNEKLYSAMSPAIFSPCFWNHVVQGTVGRASFAPADRILRRSLGERWSYPF
jgi:hypothetical protein